MRLRQILTNLIQNAIKHYGNGTPVAVTASGGAERLVIEVADSGPGIAPEEAERVFEPFYRGSGRASGDGAGLGLAITKRLAEALGGTIDGRSTARRGCAVPRQPSPVGGLRSRATVSSRVAGLNGLTT